jgi:hypothetical protein
MDTLCHFFIITAQSFFSNQRQEQGVVISFSFKFFPDEHLYIG